MLQEEGGRLKNVFKKGKERRKNKFIVLNFCPLLGHPPCGLQKSGSNFKHCVGPCCSSTFAFQVFNQKHTIIFSLNCFSLPFFLNDFLVIVVITVLIGSYC